VANAGYGRERLASFAESGGPLSSQNTALQRVSSSLWSLQSRKKKKKKKKKCLGRALRNEYPAG